MTIERLFRQIADLLEDCGPDAEFDAHTLIDDVALVLGVPNSDVPIVFVRLLVAQARWHRAREHEAVFTAIESVMPTDLGV